MFFVRLHRCGNETQCSIIWIGAPAYVAGIFSKINKITYKVQNNYLPLLRNGVLWLTATGCFYTLFFYIVNGTGVSQASKTIPL